MTYIGRGTGLLKVHLLYYGESFDTHPARFDIQLASELTRLLSAEFVHHERQPDGEIHITLGGVKHAADKYPGRMHDMCIVIESTPYGIFKVLDFQDRPGTATALCANPMFRGCLVGQYDYEHFIRHMPNHGAGCEPGFYCDAFPALTQRHRETVGLVRHTLANLDSRLFFAGTLYRAESRKWALEHLLYPHAEDMKWFDGKMERPDFFMQAARYRLSLALAWGGSFSWREFEMFGVGIPVLALQYDTVLRHPLVPDYHYIAAHARLNTGKPIDKAAAGQALWERYQEVIDDVEYLAFVTDNAKRWYDAHCDVKAIAPEIAAWVADLL